MKEESALTDRILEEIRQAGDPAAAYRPEIILSLGQHLRQFVENNIEDKDAQSALWLRIASVPEYDREIFGKILAEFELLEYTGNGSLTDQFLQQIEASVVLGWRNRWYLLRQLQSLLFTGTVLPGKRTSDLSWRIYESAYEGLRRDCISAFEEAGAGYPLQWISQEERQQDLVFVTTSQFLSEQHAPTKTALDRCYILMQELHKQVLLVNTAEQGADIGNVLLFRKMQTNYKKILCRRDHIRYRGIPIPFLQCDSRMPEVSGAQELIFLVREQKPSYIINIGGNSLVTDLLSEIVPVLTIATVFSGLATTRSQYQMIGRPLQESDRKILAFRGRSPEHVISGRFTFALKEQTQALSRKLLGVPEDGFALVIIGARIGREITDRFAALLEELVLENCFPVFVGELDYDALLARHEGLRSHSVCLGSRSDVLAVMEHMDVYLNPKRNGGGSSVVEAMVKGVVPVTLPHGDVYVNTGELFAVSDEAAMREEVLCLKRDISYYQKKSDLARERAAALMDSASAFADVLEEFTHRCHSYERRDSQESPGCSVVWNKCRQSTVTVEVLIAVAERGGVEEVINRMIASLESDKMHFRVVQMVWEGYRWVEDDVEFYPLLVGRNGHTLQEFISCYKQYLRSRENAPDIILAAGWPCLCTLARQSVKALALSSKIVSWIHCPMEQYIRKGYGNFKDLSDADAHLAISRKIADQMRNEGFSHVYQVCNPVDFPLQDVLAGNQGLHYRLLYVGRLAEEKNIAFMFHSLCENTSWTLRLVGEGPEYVRLKELAETLQISDRIEWMGWQRDPWQCAEDVDAMILSSVYESFSLVAVEAWGRGIPVISTPVGIVPELLEEGKNGYLYENGSLEQLSEILRKIERQGYVVSDPAYCRQLVLPFQTETALRDLADRIWQIVSADRIE